jgi:hypothetical protein
MDLLEEFEWFADWCEGTAPLYERLASGVLDHQDLQALAAEIPAGRTRPNVLLAAVHARLLAGDDGELADFYASRTDDPLDPTEHDPVPAFREFCGTHREALLPLLRERRTQTNSVRRCAALYPAFASVARLEGEPLSILEVGPSAGLNLRWDRYAYDYDDRRVGAEDAAVLVRSSVREGDPPLPEQPPAVAERVGLDLDPLDVTDPADVRWLRALTWPHQTERRAVLEDALAAAREDPPDVREGDAVEELPALLAELSDPVVVYNTQVLYQFEEADRERFRDLLVEAGSDRRLHWLSGEQAVDTDAPEMWLQHATVEDGALQRERLLAYEQHGRYVRWTGE